MKTVGAVVKKVWREKASPRVHHHHWRPALLFGIAPLRIIVEPLFLFFYFFIFISLVWSWLASPLPFQIHHRTHTNRQFLTTRMLVILGLVSLVWINITNIQLKILVDFSFAWIFFFLNKNKWMMAIEMHNSVIKKSIHNWKCACRHEDFK